MRALVIETSTPYASIALVDGDDISQRVFQSDRSHNAMLFGPLEELLSMVNALDLVLVGSGPGSYSGTRVGIAAAQGVAIAMGCPAVAVPSILAVPAAENGAQCLAIGDARRGSFWTAAIDGLAVTQEPALCDAAGLLQRLSASAEDTGVFSFEDPARFPLPPEIKARVSVQFPDATRLWRAWLAADQATRHAWSAEIPQPLYLKPPHITQAKAKIPAS
ncbi:MAG: tRNA (adenosine(37)-N6)-threonylcarbamoyltransferase complex dimerization subunit type 1 TsaB [Luteolibacter sp.]